MNDLKYYFIAVVCIMAFGYAAIAYGEHKEVEKKRIEMEAKKDSLNYLIKLKQYEANIQKR